MQGPDFIIIGAMKCGTTTLAAQLGYQPGIFMTTPKEPNFFSDDAIYVKGLSWYQALFATAHPADLKGEASTHYTKLPTYPHTIDRLAKITPQPRLIYLIRNPIERVVSHYIHEWTMGVIGIDLDTALDHYPELMSYGCYAAQLSPWVDRFGMDNILVLNLESMNRHPQDTLDQVGAFLGRGGLVWQDNLTRQNASSERIRRLPMQNFLIENSVATWLRRRLVPQALRDRIKANRRIRRRPTLSDDAQALLEATFTADYAALRVLCPERPDLALSYPFILHD